jgi:hypothetical protein
MRGAASYGALSRAASLGVLGDRGGAAGSPLLTGLVSYWKLEGTGTRVDSHGSNNLTDNNSVGSTTGIIGNAAQFVKANSESLSSTSTDFDLGTSNISVSLWFKTTNTSFQYLIAKGGDSASDGQGYGVALNGSGGVYGFIQDGTRLVFPVAGGGYNDGQWHHYVGVFDRDSNFTPYVDGVALTPTDISAYAGSVSNSSNPFYLGRYFAPTVGFYDGDIDEVAIYAKALTASEVAELNNSGNALTYPFQF